VSSGQIAVNNQQMLQGEEGNIKGNGLIDLVVGVSRGGGAAISLDNLAVSELP
jgi:hypothetical protein